MKKQIFSILAAGILGAGCGSGSPSGGSNNSSSNGGSGNDTLSITKTSGDNFKLIWDKKSSGYSEVAYSDGSGAERGLLVLSGNTKHKQSFDCTATNADSTEIRYSCVNTNAEAPMYEDRTFFFRVGKTYSFWVNMGTNFDKQAVANTITYNGATQSITIQ